MKLSVAAIAFALMVLASASVGAPPWTLPKDDFGGAVPLNRNRWSNVDDYPDAAAHAGQQGYVTVSYIIGVDGRLTNCNVVRSSGYPILDAIPCKVLPKRARFAPARDANGAPIATHGTSSMAFWTMP